MPATANQLQLARGKHEALYPWLWNGLVGAWVPSQGPKHPTLVLDYSGKLNHGVMTNGASMVPARTGYGVNFDGSNDYVAGNNAGNDFPVGGSVRSIACWMRSPGWSGDLGIFHWGTNGGSPTNANIHLVAASTGCILWGNGFSGQLTTGTVAVNDNKWHHVVGTYDGTNGVIWIDGKVTQSATWGAATLTGTAWHMGNFLSNAGFFPGRLQDVLLYKRELLASEIRLLATGANPFVRRRPASLGLITSRPRNFAVIVG